MQPNRAGQIPSAARFRGGHPILVGVTNFGVNVRGGAWPRPALEPRPIE
jgi:hypothetical protein